MSRSSVLTDLSLDLCVATLIHLINLKQDQIIDSRMISQFKIALARSPESFGLDTALPSLQANLGKVLKVVSFWIGPSLQYRFYYAAA